MKKLISFVLILAFVFTMIPANLAVSANGDSEIYTAFSQYEVFSDTIDDGYIGIPVQIHTYVKGTSTTKTPIAAYVINHKMERVGTESDVSIINDLLDEYIVVVIDYQNNEKAVSPGLEWSILGLEQRIASKNFLGGNSADLTYGDEKLYLVPSGCRIVRDILYFELDKHAPNGTIPYIIDMYNTYYAGKVKDSNGNLLPTATTIEECIKKDGTPIDLDLKLDIVYPSKPKKTVPVFMLAASSEARQTTPLNPRRPHYNGFLMRGYAGVCYDHEYIPMSRQDHYGYNSNAFTLYKYTANRSHSAAVRRVRQIASQYGFNADYMGTWGFSKSSAGPAILSDKTHLEKGEIATFPEKYLNGLDPTKSPEEQPWLTYDDGTPISSNVTVTYSGSGPGYHNHIFFTAPKSRETAVPLLNSSGTEDTTGGFYKLWPAVYEEIEKRDLESLCTDIVGLGHTYPITYDTRRDIDMYTTYMDFFDNQIRSKYRKEPPLVLWLTPNDKTEFDSVSIPVEVKFTRAMDYDSVKNGVKVINEATGKRVAGNWIEHNGNTRFIFNSNIYDAGVKYRIEVTKECAAEDGVHLAEDMVKRFKVRGTETLNVSKDAYVSSTAPDANYGSATSVNVENSDSAITKGYFGFERNGGFADVSKAVLLLKGSDSTYVNDVYGINDSNWEENTITYNNAPANDKESSAFLTDGVFGGAKLGSTTTETGVNAIDVTSYIRSLGSGEKATFGVVSPKKTVVTKSYDFENMTTDDFVINKDYRWGGGVSKAEIVANEAHTGTQSLRMYGRAASYARIKFYNCVNNTQLTAADKGDKYTAEMWVKTPVADAVYFSVYAGSTGDYSTASYESRTYEINANEWTKVSLDFTIDDIMIKDDIQYIGIQTASSTADLYLDDLVVKRVADKNEIVSKEGATELLCGAKLLLDTSNDIVSPAANSTYVNSSKANENFANDTKLYVKGADAFITKGVQKGYVLTSLANVADANKVTLNFSTESPANQTIEVYGIDGGDLRTTPSGLASDYKNFQSASYWDGQITYNTAFANNKAGNGVVKEFAYGGAPLGEIDCSTAGAKSVDVTAFAKAMKAAGAVNATFVLCAKYQGGDTRTLDLANADNDDFTISHSQSSFKIEDGEKYDGTTGKLLHFKRSGSDSSGYYEAISIGNLVKPGNVWTKADVGKKYKVSFYYKPIKSASSSAAYTHTLMTAIAKKGSQTLSNMLGSSDKDTAVALGTFLQKSGYTDNTWNKIEFSFALTEEMAANYANNAYLVISGYIGSEHMYFSDFKVEEVGDSVSILSGSTPFKGYDFNTNTDLSLFKLSHPDKSEVSIAKGAGKDGSDCLLFNKKEANYNYAVTIPRIFTDGEIWSASDVGKTFRLTFKYKPVHNAGQNCTVLYRIHADGSANGTDGTVATTVGSLVSGQWYDADVTFTLTEELYKKPYRTSLIIGSYGATQQVYVDDVQTYVVSQPKLSITKGSATTNEDSLMASVVKASYPSASFSGEKLVIKSADPSKELIDAKKAYISFDVTNPSNVRSAKLKLDILNKNLGAAQKLELYALNGATSFDKDSVTYNNAYGNNLLSNSFTDSLLFGGKALMTINPAEVSVEGYDVSDYVKQLSDTTKAVFALATNDSPNITVYKKDFESAGETFYDPRDVRYGGQSDVKANIITEADGNKCLELSGIKYSYARARFTNAFGVPYFTSADKGKKYRVTFSVKPQNDAKILAGAMSVIPNAVYPNSNDTSSATNVDSKSGYINYAAAPANVWTTFSYVYEVTDRSIGGKINAVSIGQSGPSATQPNTPVMLIDNVKVELLNGSEELEISKNAVLTVENDVPDTTVNAASITGIVSSGAFNKGDSVLINLDTITSFKKTVSDVKFYVNGEEYKATGNKGSSYSLKLINLDEGDYTVYGEVTFSDGESVSSSEETFTIAGGKSYSADAPSVRGSLASGNLVVSKRIKNNLTTDATGVIIAAVYDSNGNLIKVAKGNVTPIAAGFENDLSVSLEKIGTVPSGSYLKVMVWSDMTNMLPLVSADILS